MFENLNKIKYSLLNNINQSGMTLIELLVVISIFMILTSVTIFDYGSFKSSVSIGNLADDIALSIRKAQSYAIGVHSSSSNFTSGYGVHFTTNTNTLNKLTGSNKSFVIFNDLPLRDKTYNYPSSGSCGIGAECSEILNIITTDQISAIYLNDDTSPIPSTSSIDISFVRPNPDAYFCYKSPSNSTFNCDKDNTDISHVRITVSSYQSNKSKSIIIWNTGYISIQ